MSPLDCFPLCPVLVLRYKSPPRTAATAVWRRGGLWVFVVAIDREAEVVKAEDICWICDLEGTGGGAIENRARSCCSVSLIRAVMS